MHEDTTDAVDFGRALQFAAVQQAPSIVGARPWQWQMDRGRLHLYLDTSDTNDRLHVISCGAALHHARIVLAACGVKTVVRVQPDAADQDLLAELEPVGAHETLPRELDLFAAIGRTEQPSAMAPTPAVLRRLRSAVSAEGAHLDEMSTAYGWCAVLVTRTDDRMAWLDTGKALSAALLTATDAGLAATIEHRIGCMAGRLPAGFGFAQIGVRIGQRTRHLTAGDR